MATKDRTILDNARNIGRGSRTIGMNASKVSLQILLLDRRPADRTLLALQYHGATRSSSPKKNIGSVASMRRTLSLMALACGIEMLAVYRTRDNPTIIG